MEEILINRDIAINNSLLEFIISIANIILISAIALATVKILKIVIKKVLITPTSRFIENERKLNTINFILNWSIKYVIYFFAVSAILMEFGIPVQSILAVAGIGSVALGFGSQSLVRDIITGVFILIEDQLAPGDMVSIGNIKGEVETLALRTTHIRSFDGNLHIIPNSEIKIVTNMSRGYKRVLLNVSINYKGNTDLIENILVDTLNDFYKISNGLLAKPKILSLTELGEDYIKAIVIADCKVAEDSYKIEGEMRKFIKESLEDKGITIRTI